jgi:hypothetical protein
VAERDPFEDPFTASELHVIIGRARRESRIVGDEDYKAALRELARAAVVVKLHMIIQEQHMAKAAMVPRPDPMVEIPVADMIAEGSPA